MANITGYTKVGAEAKFTHKAQLDADTTTNINNGASATRTALNAAFAGEVGSSTSATRAAMDKATVNWANARDPQWGIAGDGVTDDTAAINNMLQTVFSQGDTWVGGVAYFPRGTYIVNGIELRSRVTMRGAGKRATIFKAKAGGTSDAAIKLRPGPVQASFLEDCEVLGNGVAGQHGIRLTAALGSDSSGGWWESGMRRVRVTGFLGHQIWLEGGTGGLLPHQFLSFEHVEAFSTGGLRALHVTDQVGQVTWNACQFDGDGVVSTDTENAAGAYVGTPTASGWAPYAHTFINCTFQENLYGVIVDGASPVNLIGCYWENTGRAVLAKGGARLVTVIAPNFSNGAGVSDSSGYLFKAEAASFIRWDSVKAGGTVNKLQSADSTSSIVPGTYFGPTAPGTGSTGVTRNIAESGGTLTIATALTTYLVNGSATTITNIAGTVRAPGETIYLKAHGGSIVLGLGGNISIGKTSGTLTVPQDAWVQLVRTDSGSLGWAVVGMSPA